MRMIHLPALSGPVAKRLFAAIACMVGLLPVAVVAGETGRTGAPDLTTHTVGYLALAIFALAYLLVTAEEFTHLRKSKPVIIAAGLIWGLIAWVSTQSGHGHAAEAAARPRGVYTFFGHLRWTPVIGLGYVASIFVDMWINASYF